MKTTTLVILGLMAALAFAGPAAGAETSNSAEACEPVWVDNDGEMHVNPDCIGPGAADAPFPV